jgi:hypothetical protein
VVLVKTAQKSLKRRGKEEAEEEQSDDRKIGSSEVKNPDLRDYRKSPK